MGHRFFIMISFKNVTYKYANDPTPAVKNLSFDINSGESLCLMGANGSGKTTLARLIAGLIKPFRGRIDIGHNGNTRVGILFQNPDNQMVAVTVEKEIAFALENQNVPLKKMETRITQTLERFSITHLRKKLNSELSGGEKQKVAIARAIIGKPLLLLADEPTGSLDPEASRGIIGLLRKINIGGTTVLLASHSVSLFEGDRYRILKINNGLLAAHRDNGG